MELTTVVGPSNPVTQPLEIVYYGHGVLALWLSSSLILCVASTPPLMLTGLTATKGGIRQPDNIKYGAKRIYTAHMHDRKTKYYATLGNRHLTRTSENVVLKTSLIDVVHDSLVLFYPCSGC